MKIVYSLCMTKLPHLHPFLLWTFHTAANALPAGILAHSTMWRQVSDTAAMVFVSLVFVFAAPFTPLWPLFHSASPWGQAFRAALWFRSIWSLFLILELTTRDGRMSFLEMYIGAFWRYVLDDLRSSAISYDQSTWWRTSLMTLFVGLTLLGVTALLAGGVRLFMWLRAWCANPS